MKLDVEQQGGARVLKRGALEIPFAGERAFLEPLDPGAMVEAECARAGGMLIALALVGAGEPATVEALDDAFARGALGEVEARLGRLEEIGVSVGPELLAARVRLAAGRGEPAQAEETFRTLLAAMSEDWSRVRSLFAAYESLERSSRERVGSELTSWVEARSGALPKDLPLHLLPQAGRSASALLAEARSALKTLSDSDPSAPWPAEASFETACEELSARSLTAAEAAELEALRAEASRRQAVRRERQRRADAVGPDASTADLATVERIFEVTLPADLRRAWEVARGGPAPLPGRRGVRFYDVWDEGSSALVLESDLLSDALGRTSNEPERLLALAFAVRGVLGDKYWVYALDLRAPREDGDFPVIEFLENRGVDLAEDRPAHRVAASSAEWLTRAPEAPPPACDLAPIEPLVDTDRERLERIRRELVDRGEKMNAPLDEQEIAAFEARHGVRLPAQLRAFVATIGDGGAGPPEYGLWQLLDTPALAEPFRLTRAARSDRAGKGSRGRLCVGHDGCGRYFYLVVTGDARGQIWASEDGHWAPVMIRRRRADLLSWYESWLRNELTDI